MTTKQAADKWSVSERLVRRYCSAGRIPKAKQRDTPYGKYWWIPDDATKPTDPRKKPPG